MPKITLTWNQLFRLSDIVEGEAEDLRKYPCDDDSQLKKTCTLRNRLYKEIAKHGKSA